MKGTADPAHGEQPVRDDAKGPTVGFHTPRCTRPTSEAHNANGRPRGRTLRFSSLWTLPNLGECCRRCRFSVVGGADDPRKAGLTNGAFIRVVNQYEVQVKQASRAQLQEDR